MTTSTGQVNTDLTDWRQQAREQGIKEIAPDTSSASQAVNVVSDDDEDDQEKKTPRHLTTSEALEHLDDLFHFYTMKNNANTHRADCRSNRQSPKYKVVCLKTK